jgi:L-ascorbate 6-phosphate lactonase
MPRNPAVKTGPALQEEIRGTTVGKNQVALWWLGQATFCLKFGDKIIYTDPFYRAENDEPPTLQELPLKPEEFTGASLICCTHEHLDHTDPKTLPGASVASPNAKIVVPKPTVDFVKSLDVPESRLLPMRGDDTLERDDIRVHALPAAHMRLEYSHESGHRYLGYVIQSNGITLYHPGDTQPYDGWARRVSTFDLDVALLPISGRDNLFWQQALYFCANHRPRVAIPMHYGLFKDFNEDPQKLVDGLAINVPEQTVRVLKVGEKFVFEK